MIRKHICNLNLFQEQKKLEAQARRERIMAQYLQKKAEKELEESGRAPPKTPQARGLVGGGGGATGRAQQVSVEENQ